ncbi:MAG: S53 family peptidase [Ktedonobacterales bacterium]
MASVKGNSFVRSPHRAARPARWVCAIVLLASLMTLLAACTPFPRATATHPPTPRPAAPVRLGPTDGARILSLSFPLRRRSPADLAALLAAIENPHSPLYHHYLTSTQYAAAYGPSPTERAQAEVALRALGLTITAADANATLIQATGSAQRIEAIFHVHLYDYRSPDGTPYIAADGVPFLPLPLASGITGVIGLDTRPAVQRRMADAPDIAQQAQQIGGGGLDPSALRAIYNVSPLTSKGLNGSGQTIALAEIDRFHQSDIATYDNTFAINGPPLQVVSVAGGSRSYSPEPVLDIEVIRAIAPRSGIIVYESGSDLGHLAQMFDRIVSDNRAQIVSISLGACELGIDSSSASGFLATLDSTFQRADAQGMSVLVASGDSGAYGCQDNHLAVDLPAASPFVTAVGGTAVFPTSNNSYGREDGWEGPLEGAGGGGGLSVIYRRPAWQSGPDVNNSYSNGMRQVPDVSADADPLTGYRIYYSGDNSCSGSDCWTVIGGTSAAAPFWAALIALANQQGHRKLGFLNPALYALGSSGSASAVFHDVTGGGNLYYQATPGWDYSTGLGSPDAASLVAALLAR